MQKIAARNWLIATTAALSVATLASHAFADCDDDQTTAAGKAVAAAANAKLSTVVPGAGKQMISMDTCETAGGTITAEFKYNVIGSDGLYWAQGRAKLVGANVQDLKFTSLSPNLAAASAKSGVKLAAN